MHGEPTPFCPYYIINRTSFSPWHLPPEHCYWCIYNTSPTLPWFVLPREHSLCIRNKGKWLPCNLERSILKKKKSLPFIFLPFIPYLLLHCCFSKNVSPYVLLFNLQTDSSGLWIRMEKWEHMREAPSETLWRQASTQILGHFCFQ